MGETNAANGAGEFNEQNDAAAPGAPQPTPAAPSAPAAPPPSPDKRDDSLLQTDIARILGDVKLPERRTVPGAKTEPEPQTQYATTLADPTAPQAAAAGTPPPPTTSPANPNQLVSLHTLKDDLQHVVQENKISYVRAIALEEEKRHRIEQRSPVKARASKHSFLTIFITFLLFSAGVAALGAVYIITQQRAVQSNAALQSVILFAEQSVPFPIDNESPGDIRRTLAAARTSDTLTLGAILEIVPVHTSTDAAGNTTATPATFGEFLGTLGTRAPAELPRALGDDFFFGIHSVDENAPIFVIPVTSYERAFAAMLEWEPFMSADLDPLFTPLPPQAPGPDGVPVYRTFEDTVMRNYDVRALKDDSGQIQLYYSFPTRTILIIAESPFSFAEILSRLRADRRL